MRKLLGVIRPLAGTKPHLSGEASIHFAVSFLLLTAGESLRSILKMRQTLPTSFLKIAFNSFDTAKTHSRLALCSEAGAVGQIEK